MSEKEEMRHNRARRKARNRANVAKEWFKNNKLTSGTISEFHRLMEKANLDFELTEAGKK